MSKSPCLSIALLALAASTCTWQGARAQAQVLGQVLGGGDETSRPISEQIAEAMGARDEPRDEWRLDGTIERADARAGVFWLSPGIVVLRDEDADLNLAGQSRRIVVDAATRVWTPDGQARPFGFNALRPAMRLGREVSVVGVWDKGLLRARLLVLPDLLPANWRPEPFGAALRPRAVARKTLARKDVARRSVARSPAKVAAARVTKIPSAQTPVAIVPPVKAPVAPIARGTARISTARPRVTAIVRAPVARAPIARAPIEKTPVVIGLPAKARAAKAPQRKLPNAKEVRPRLAAQNAAPRLRLEKLDRVVARPSVSAASPLAQVPSGARMGARDSGRAQVARSETLDLSPRDSRPPLLRPPSPPQVAKAPGLSDVQVALPASAPRAPTSESALVARGAGAAVEVAPRDARREVEKQRLAILRASPPRASSSPASEASSAPVPAQRTGEAPTPRVEMEMEMRAPVFKTAGRSIVRPPQLSTPALESSSRVAESAASVRRAPVLSPNASQVLGGATRATDAMQVLASGERLFLAARARFAPLRALQDEVRWPDFSGGPGWDGALASSSSPTRVAVSSEPSEVESQKMIALTFDDGPHPNTRRVLDILDAQNARATFFVVGRNVRRHTEILRDIALRGHDIGNHSDQHVQGTRLDAKAWQREVDEGNRAIEEAIGLAPRWFRAPGCRYSMEALAALSSRNMVRVDSSNNSGDWHEPSPERIVARVLSRLAPGQVLLFHDPLPQTVRALPLLLRELRARGYKCVTLSELARASAQTPGFSPPLRPPGQGIVLPPGFERHRAPQVLEGSEALSSDAPVLLQVAP